MENDFGRIFKGLTKTGVFQVNEPCCLLAFGASKLCLISQNNIGVSDTVKTAVRHRQVFFLIPQFLNTRQVLKYACLFLLLAILISLLVNQIHV